MGILCDFNVPPLKPDQLWWQEEKPLSALTIRQLNEHTHARLRARAAKHGRSVEAEVCAILDSTVDLPEGNILVALHATFREAGGMDLELPDRNEPPRTVGLT